MSPTIFTTPPRHVKPTCRCALRVSNLWTDSGGAGQFRGGLGYTSEVVWLGGEALVTIRRDRHRFPPWGLAGGHPGWPCRSTLLKVGRNDRGTSDPRQCSPSTGAIVSESGPQAEAATDRLQNETRKSSWQMCSMDACRERAQNRSTALRSRAMRSTTAALGSSARPRMSGRSLRSSGTLGLGVISAHCHPHDQNMALQESAQRGLA